MWLEILGLSGQPLFGIERNSVCIDKFLINKQGSEEKI